MSLADYIDSVLSGERPTGRLERLCVERSVRLWKDPKYYFDQEEVDRVLRIVSLFKHTGGDYYGKPWQFLPWQYFFFAHIFGFKYKDSGQRVTRKVLLCMAKKGGKSEIAGAVADLMTFFDSEKTAECYSAANKLDQAMFCFNAARRIADQLAKDSEAFGKIYEVHNSFNNRKIFNNQSENFFKPISADGKTLDGTNAHLGIIDEYHEAKTSEVPKNLSSGMVNRSQPLLLYVTTRGFNIYGPLAKMEKVYIDILEDKIKDDSVFPLIFAMDKEDEEYLAENWGKPFEEINNDIWFKCMPGYGQAPTVQGIKNIYTEAITEGVDAEVNFKTKNCNIWVRQSKSWITDNIWKKGGKDIDLEILKGKQAFGAYDLSSKNDLSCLGLLFPPQEDLTNYVFLCKFYCPMDGAKRRSKKDQVPYLDWERQGILTLTPGNMIDYEYIENDVIQFNNDYDVVNYQFDPMFAREFSTGLYAQEIDVQEFKQTVTNFNEPIEKLEKLIAKGELNHLNHEIMRWMAGNVFLYYNSTGLKRFDKKKSSEKIDGMVTLGMCMGGYLDYLAENEDLQSVDDVI